MKTMLNEKALLSGARRFDEQALTEIYDRYSPGLYGYSVRLLGQPDLAEECVAETFSRFLHALHRGKGPRKHLQAYLYRVAHNWVSDTYRRGPPSMSPLDAERQISAEAGPGEMVEGKLDSERVRAALFELTPDQRQVVVLRFLEGLTNKEVAAALNKSDGAVKALQHRALATLKRLLVSQEEVT